MTALQSTQVKRAEEMTSLRRNAEAKAKDDIVEWLLVERDKQAEISVTEFQKTPPDFGIINAAELLKDKYFAAAEEIRKLRALSADLTAALRNRVIVALREAELPPWRPTHRHYKGKLYRVTGVRYDADGAELVEMVEYDDADGMKFVLTRSRFESVLESGRARYEFIAGDVTSPA